MTVMHRSGGIQPHLWVLVLVQGVVSAASLVVEILAGRMLAPHVGMSLYTWTSVIAIVLAGFSLGHWWGGRIANRPIEEALRITGWTLIGAALTTAAAAWLLRLAAGPVLGTVEHPIWAIVVLCSAVFFLPSLFAGVPAPVLAQVAVVRSERSGEALGAMFAAGAVGAIAGTLLAGFLFISWLGTAATLAVVTAVYVLAALVCFALSRRVTARLGAALVVIGAGLTGLPLLAPPQCDHESDYFCIRTVDLSADPARPVHLMVLDHLAHGIGARDVPQVMFTEHAAMLLELSKRRAPSPEATSYFIGGGSYSVPRALADAGFGEITVSEIDPMVTEIAERDFWLDRSEMVIFHEDARRALLSRPERRYDLIVGDAFTDVAVPAHLITREFMQLVAGRLTPEGSYLMNVIDYEGRLRALASMVATAREVFPHVEVWTRTDRPPPGERAVFVLVAGRAPGGQGGFVVPAPEPVRFAALPQEALARLAETRGQILTDDFAPIDRLMGRMD
ncbi:hypothetical protein SAMN04490248_108103 [Salinihabitans flavidus]|uniref:Spermidine synthase n=1 Tax=Salinihabitans flavidus TaxID=569882 RepID=A0A1H8RCR6_9RHOB|nr:hypothetical protein SAMN04490248_108103 [Salinihabitans flavidus]